MANHTIKKNRVQAASSWGIYPWTYWALEKSVPTSAWDLLPSRAIVELIDALAAAHADGRCHARKEAVENGGIYSQNKFYPFGDPKNLDETLDPHRAPKTHSDVDDTYEVKSKEKYWLAFREKFGCVWWNIWSYDKLLINQTYEAIVAKWSQTIVCYLGRKGTPPKNARKLIGLEFLRTDEPSIGLHRRDPKLILRSKKGDRTFVNTYLLEEMVSATTLTGGVRE